MNQNWTDRLSEYLDGGLDAATREALEARLAEDAELRMALEQLGEVKTRAASLVSTAPEADLWPGIRDRLDDLGPAARPRRMISVTIPQFAAAAGVMLLLGVGLARMGADSAAVEGGTLAGVEAPADARFASDDAARYPLFVQDLESRLEAGRSVLDDQTVRVLEQSLAKIDQAIGQAQRALESDPNNAYLNQHLASARARKLRFLENATALVAAST